MKTQTIYDECMEKGFEIDHHESDLYIKDCPKARELLDRHNQPFTSFISQIDGEAWLDVPFAYQPFWNQGANGEKNSNSG